jgi:hypothetical protein
VGLPQEIYRQTLAQGTLIEREKDLSNSKVINFPCLPCCNGDEIYLIKKHLNIFLL